jgi:hypothetical protein
MPLQAMKFLYMLQEHKWQQGGRGLVMSRRDVRRLIQPLVGIVGLFWAGSMVLATPVGTAFTDLVEFGKAQSESSHGLKTSGHVKFETLSVEMGNLRDRYEVLTLTGKGAKTTVVVRAPHPGRPLLLEVQEIHDRRADAFGYMVLANDRELYFRTYQEYGAGPNHYFVQVPSDVIGQAETVKITFRGEGGAPFSLGKLWAYADFFGRVAEPEKVYRGMGVLLPSALLKTPEQRQRYAGLKCYAPLGYLDFVDYGFGGLDGNRARLHKWLQLSADTAMPVQMIINGTAWGGMPTGPDGLGGYFSDPRYSLLSYNAARARFQPAWPNMWASSSWPTLRDPWLNAFLEKRFQRVFGDLPERLDRFRLQGTPAAPILVREFAPASGEISNVTIAHARKDGVTLEPADGLGRDERLWMHRDAVRGWQEFADSTVAAAGRDRVMVDRGIVSLPKTQLADDLFSHPDFLTDAPMNDPRWGGGQHGMVEGLWSSGEMGRGTEYRDIAMYDYVRARGKLAMINMERTILKEDFTVLKNHYQRGFQFVTLFNAYAHDEKYVKAVDGMDDEPALPAVHREPALLDVICSRDLAPGPSHRIVSIENLGIRNNLRLAVTDPARPGQVTYRLDNVGEPFTSPLSLHLDGRVSPGAGNRIEVLAGDGPDRLRTVATLTDRQLACPDHWTPYMTSETTVDLGDGMIGKSSYLLRLVFHSADAADAAFLLKLHVGTQWARRSGHVAANPFTVRQSRVMQLWVQDRAMAARWLKRYRALGGEDAVYREAADLFERGWYRSALNLLAGEVSQLVPATYVVRGHGRLGRYPVEVALPDESAMVRVTLHKVGMDGYEFSLRSEAPQQGCRLTISGLDPDRSWRVEPVAPDRFRLLRDLEGAGAAPATVTIRDGKVAVDLEVARVEERRPPLPRTLVARYLGRQHGKLIVDLQDLELMGYDEALELPIAKGATSVRVPDNPAFPAAPTNIWPERLDRVELTLDASNQVTAVKATYGRDRGRIRAFYPPVLVGKLSNGVIELENGNRYALHYDKKTGTSFDTVALQGAIVDYEIRALEEAFKPGQDVEVAYCPYAAKGGLKRLIRVSQPRTLLLDEDFTKTTGDEWKAKAVAVEGLDVRLHKPEPNYLTKVQLRLLRPVAAFVPGIVTYHIAHDRPLATTVVEFTARAFEDSSRVEFWVSDDARTWTKLGQFDNTWQNNISQQLTALPPQFIDLTPAVMGRKGFYLKVQLAVNSADERFCVGRLRVITEDK